ncbi:MAG: hypothetical protein HYY93_01970 [Planctomycetes bacterium]|nr:hypothetical protein [Planctomycetota bacterium]
MASTRREIEILNVSFLDVFACAIGSVIFIILNVFLNSIDKVSAPSAAQVREEQWRTREREEERERSREREQEEAEKRKRLGREAERLEQELEEGRSRLAALQRDNTDLRARAQARAGRSEADRQVFQDLAEARRESREVEAQANELRARATEEEKAGQDARREMERLMAGDGTGAGAYSFRIPLERSVDKSINALIECAKGKAYEWSPRNYDFVLWLLPRDNAKIKQWNDLLDRNKMRLTDRLLGDAKRFLEKSHGVPSSDGKTWKFPAGCGTQFDQFGITKKAVCLLERIRKAGAQGDSAADLRTAHSKLGAILKEVNPEKEYLNFIVRPSGFEVFRECRSLLDSKGIDCSWSYVEEESTMPSFLGGGGGGTVK